MEVGMSEGISFLSLIVSIVAVLFAQSSSATANKTSKENLRLQSGMVELEISQSIENAKSKVNDIAMIIAPLKAKEDSGSLDTEGVSTLESYHKVFSSSVQTLMNTYDVACSKYIDGKVDRDRFKKSYHHEVRNIIENKDFKEYFDPITSKYKPILMVYEEWVNLESA